MIDLHAIAASLPRGSGRVHATVKDGLAEVVLDHPARRNAFTPHMMVDLAGLDVSGARCILLHGEGQSFCSGGDLGAVRQHLAVPGAGRALATFMANAIARLSRHAPIVGCLEGHALGGGAELLAACDIVIASPSAEVGFVQARLGVSPGFGGGAFLARRVGPGRTRAILVAAERLSASRAWSLGLVEEIADPPLPRARELATRIAAMPPEAVAGAREVAEAWVQGDGGATELDVFDRLWGGPAHIAALDRR